MASLQPSTINCWICGKAVSLNDCKFEEHGKAVHEQCAVAQIHLNSATRLPGATR
jgi:hypothetical protein